MTDKLYKNWVAMSDKALLKHISDFVKHHRMEQNKTQDTLATEAGISRSTLSLLERGESVTLPTLIQVLRMLDQLQVMDAFRIEKQISPILLARMEQKKRQRVREKKKDNQPESNW
ncbi:MAG: helix-turn-helix transcriptional regulator [Mariniphaga sp.]|nr:helix-turn-helix transcriptional regulator [Mariniphaga sp.]